MYEQMEITIGDKVKQYEDEFTEDCKPLSDLLDSVRSTEGFPIGKDEDILALSDPPYYTACPNPYISEFIIKYGQPYNEATDHYECTPYVGDVSEGKSGSVYTAHSYHTKVPHKAIMKYIEHYTKETDIVYDGFCGSGMTGVAAQLLGRKVILSDLSPIATFIAYNYNTEVDLEGFQDEAKRLLSEIENEYGWMYETLHIDGKTKGRINYTVWSDIFICPYCANEYVFWQVATSKETGTVNESYKCPHCKSIISKKKCKRKEIVFYDYIINEEITCTKQVPVLINYTVGNKKFEKVPDQFDISLIEKIEKDAIPYWFPTERMPIGNEARRNDKVGITHVHHFYTKRNLWILAALWEKAHKVKINTGHVLFLYEQLIWGMCKLSRYVPTHYSQANQYLSGTLYVGSQVVEVTPRYIIENKTTKLAKVFMELRKKSKAIFSTNSANKNNIADNTIDYIFTDPPFGDNLMYSELNFLWEAWHRVYTNNRSEAIINSLQNKGVLEYKELMTSCFKEMYRILKPNRWITVVFHNSKAAVWNAIMDSLAKSGFIVAQVSILDKQQGSFKQITAPGTVKNDLVINAYKPRKYFEENFLRMAGRNLERDFVDEQLEHLPIESNLERTEQMLYSKTLAHYIQRGYEIRLNAKQFYTLLRDNFKLIDGYWFTDNQVLKYEEWKKKQGLNAIKGLDSGQFVFIIDEKTALLWLYNFLETPQTYGDIFTAYSKAIANVEDDIPELRELLSNNFIAENGHYRRPMSEKEKELVDLQREKELTKVFEKILIESRLGGKKLKNIRREAIVHGFTQAYRERRFEDILTVAKKLDSNIFDTNSEINDFAEIAKLKIGREDY